MTPRHTARRARGGDRRRATHPLWRVARWMSGGIAAALLGLTAYALWEPGVAVTDGRHDLGRNAIWLQHGWLGDDAWFERYGKTALIARFRSREAIRALAETLRAHHITDLYPHLSPTYPSGKIATADPQQTERFLDETTGLRVMPWVGGVWGRQARPEDAAWRARLVASVTDLLAAHPRLAGVHVNIEPCPSGSAGFLALLDALKRAMPQGKMLSVAGFPPSPWWRPGRTDQWDADYIREVSLRADQIAFMTYDSGLPLGNVYRALMRGWTTAALQAATASQVLIGLPAYDDAGVPWHDPEVENLPNALAGLHAGLSGFAPLPPNYQGTALCSEWEMDAAEWAVYRREFLKPTAPGPAGVRYTDAGATSFGRGLRLVDLWDRDLPAGMDRVGMVRGTLTRAQSAVTMVTAELWGRPAAGRRGPAACSAWLPRSSCLCQNIQPGFGSRLNYSRKQHMNSDNAPAKPKIACVPNGPYYLLDDLDAAPALPAGLLPSDPDLQACSQPLGVILPVNDWATILPSRTTNVSVPTSYTFSAVSAAHRM
jgi:hypothetical protein